MGDFFEMVVDLWKKIFGVFDAHPLDILGYKVSLTYAIFAFIVIGFVISVYWKGAKS